MQEKHDLESFAIKRGESEQDQSPLQTRPRNFRGGAIGEQRFSASIMGTNPAAPINFVEEPVHDHEQNDYGEKAGGRLQVERGNTFGHLPHDSDRDAPRD